MSARAERVEAELRERELDALLVAAPGDVRHGQAVAADELRAAVEELVA